MNNIIRIAIVGVLCTMAPAVLAGPPAKSNASYYPPAVACSSSKGCTRNVSKQLTRAALYGTDVPKCHPATSGEARWGKAQPACSVATM